MPKIGLSLVFGNVAQKQSMLLLLVWIPGGLGVTQSAKSGEFVHKIWKLANELPANSAAFCDHLSFNSYFQAFESWYPASHRLGVFGFAFVPAWPVLTPLSLFVGSIGSPN